jgi:hypothetical protein
LGFQHPAKHNLHTQFFFFKSINKAMRKIQAEKTIELT